MHNPAHALPPTRIDLFYSSIVAANIHRMEELGQRGPFDTVGANFALWCYDAAKYQIEKLDELVEENY